MQEWVELYQSGESLAQIARRYRTYPQKVQRYLRKVGIKRRSVSEASATLPIEKILSDYKSGKSARQIAQELDSYTTCVTQVLKRHNVVVEKPTTKADWSALDDKMFFAYWLGWMLSDGYICYKRAGGRNRGIVVGLTTHKQDDHIIEFIKQRICPSATINCKNGSKQLVLSIPRNYAEELEGWGLQPRKSLTLHSTPKLIGVDDKFFHQMLIGYIEGDGHINSRGGCEISCGSKSWLQFLVKRIRHPKIRSITPHNGSWRLRFGQLAMTDLYTTWNSLNIPYRLLRRKWNKVVDGFPMFFKDELKHKYKICENIRKQLNQSNLPDVRIRPQKCKIELIGYKEAAALYERCHIMGKCAAKYHIGCQYQSKIIAALSLRRPSRPQSGDWEIARMARDNDYFIYGLWSYLWKWIINQGIIAGKIVTFSDNRLSYGKVYGLMGFKKVGEVNPDYYWVKDGVRYHKSALRKTTQEKATGKTEDVLRREQGYLKVWDRGKIKWSIDI